MDSLAVAVLPPSTPRADDAPDRYTVVGFPHSFPLADVGHVCDLERALLDVDLNTRVVRFYESMENSDRPYMRFEFN